MEGGNSRSGRRFGGMKKALMEAVDVGVDSAENVWFYEEQRGGGGGGGAGVGGAGVFRSGYAK